MGHLRVGLFAPQSGMVVCTEYCGKSKEEMSQRMRDPVGTIQQMSHMSMLTRRVSPGLYGAAYPVRALPRWWSNQPS